MCYISYKKGTVIQDQNVILLTLRLKVSSFLVPEINKAKSKSNW